MQRVQRGAVVVSFANSEFSSFTRSFAVKGGVNDDPIDLVVVVVLVEVGEEIGVYENIPNDLSYEFSGRIAVRMVSADEDEDEDEDEEEDDDLKTELTDSL
tara:strand:+ start:83 stop:385 length:303 start_codon:yes stop_codon:yes gene_type:complete